MADQFDLFEAIYSQRQITRYKPDPVPQAEIQKLIDAAVRLSLDERACGGST